jgi:hypothetical protein
MCPEFSYSKGRILPSIEFIMKNPAAETAGYLNVRNCLFIFAR